MAGLLEGTFAAAWPPHLPRLDELTAPPAAIVLRGEAADLAVWQYELDRLYDPRRLVLLASPPTRDATSPALAEKGRRRIVIRRPNDPGAAESSSRPSTGGVPCAGA